MKKKKPIYVTPNYKTMGFNPKHPQKTTQML